jgi:hypothetical protein
MPRRPPVSGGGIIGLDSWLSSPATWQVFRSAGTNLRVAEWTGRIEKGEKLEQVASESGFTESTMKNMILNNLLYFKVCQLIGIVSGGGTDV